MQHGQNKNNIYVFQRNCNTSRKMWCMKWYVFFLICNFKRQNYFMRQRNRLTGRQGQTDRLADRPTDRHTAKQIDRHICGRTNRLRGISKLFTGFCKKSVITHSNWFRPFQTPSLELLNLFLIVVQLPYELAWPFVGLMVGRFVGWSVCHDFLKGLSIYLSTILLAHFLSCTILCKCTQ